jgi:hypothetical protein
MLVAVKGNFRKIFISIFSSYFYAQGVFEMRADILTTSYWLHVRVELGKNIKKNIQKLNYIYFLSYNFF